MNALSKYRQYACRLLDAFALFGVALALAQICYVQQTISQNTPPKNHTTLINQQSHTTKECFYE
jgi:hypothetical protein